MMMWIKFLGIISLSAGRLFPVTAADVPINTPSPMLEPAFPACEQFHLAVEGDNCNSIIAGAQLNWYEFLRINPAIGGAEGCTTKILVNTWYCVKTFDPAAAPPWLTLQPKPSQTKAIQGPERTSISTKTRSKKKKAPKITKAPVPNYNECRYGDCWYAFGELSKGKDEYLSEASSKCSKVFATGCREGWEWPGKVGRLCNGCQEFSSACPCFLAGHYHTKTHNPLYSRPGQQDQNDFLPTDD
ncbi:hypothetical protein EDB81DRAFT_755972 [Dactylonectria macrodidyma]|uniref:LysM domain-containing protein n=1 Tax=Dactylonectria macrodidyma TaxID=307937 RepID=A0A9P9FI81_9HYPO|nr:hypothetical protein EDB81DRAFT_755972 [Dactylonectria macrodidyma]